MSKKKAKAYVKDVATHIIVQVEHSEVNKMILGGQYKLSSSRLYAEQEKKLKRAKKKEQQAAA